MCFNGKEGEIKTVAMVIVRFQGASCLGFVSEGLGKAFTRGTQVKHGADFAPGPEIPPSPGLKNKKHAESQFVRIENKLSLRCSASRKPFLS